MKTQQFRNSEPTVSAPHPVCVALRGSHEGEVTVMFGSDPVQPDALSNPCELQNN